MKIHHIELNTANLEQSYRFYQRFFEFIGCLRTERSERHFAIYGSSFYFYVNQCPSEHLGFQFDRYRPGLNHLAFTASDKAQVDAWHRIAAAETIRVLDPPGWYGEGYYAVYFADPDGMKLELGWEALSLRNLGTA